MALWLLKTHTHCCHQQKRQQSPRISRHDPRNGEEVAKLLPAKAKKEELKVSYTRVCKRKSNVESMNGTITW